MSDIQAPADGGQGSTTPAAPVVTSTVTNPPAAPQPQNSTVQWLGDGVDETLTGYVQNKGWDTPVKAVDSYRNLEKLLGADKAGNAVVIPKGDADPKEWQAVYDKLGRPTGADGYKVQWPEHVDKGAQDFLTSTMHELGLSKSQGEALAAKLNTLSSDKMNAYQASQAAQFQEEDNALKAGWGGAYTQNLAAAQAGARGLGLDATTIDKMSEGIGHKATMELLFKVGARMQEPDFVAGDNAEKFGNALTPGQAKAKIEELKTDKDFVKKYLSGDTAAKAEMARLHAFAHPEQSNG